MVQIRVTLQLIKLLGVLLEAPHREHYGLELAKAAGLATGTIYPTLARLEAVGWLTSDWELIDASAEGRRPRRYYRLTGAGEAAARSLMAEISEAATVSNPRRLRPEAGGATL